MSDFAAARRNMIDSQLRPNRVLDPRVAQAMAEVPREAFVPGALGGVAYVDEDLEIAPGRYLMEPMVFGRLLQVAAIGPDDIVLDLGCGGGYSTAVLARLAGTVVAVEPDPALRAQATEAMARIGADNAAVVDGDLAAGIPGQGPYDVIVLGGAAETIPSALKEQLAEGGRLVAVLVRDGVGKATVIERQGALFGTREVFEAATPILPGLTLNKGFSF